MTTDRSTGRGHGRGGTEVEALKWRNWSGGTEVEGLKIKVYPVPLKSHTVPSNVLSPFVYYNIAFSPQELQGI